MLSSYHLSFTYIWGCRPFSNVWHSTFWFISERVYPLREGFVVHHSTMREYLGSGKCTKAHGMSFGIFFLPWIVLMIIVSVPVFDQTPYIFLDPFQILFLMWFENRQTTLMLKLHCIWHRSGMCKPHRHSWLYVALARYVFPLHFFSLHLSCCCMFLRCIFNVSKLP